MVTAHGGWHLVPIMKHLQCAGVNRWADVNPEHLDGYLLSMLERGLKASTR